VPSSSYVKDINYLEVAFSPQNEINEDINSSLGYFNIGDYIGDPRLTSTTDESYPDLDALRETYFEKYKANYDWWDFIRLIKYYDNSLFKILKDYTPARAGLSTGVVIKQHLLERNKYPVPQLDTQTTTSFYSGSTWNTPGVYQDLTLTGSISVEETIGSNGGSFPDTFYITATSASFLIEPGQVGRIFLSQSGVHNVTFAFSSSDGGGSATTALKVYDSASLPSTFAARNLTTIATSSQLNGYYEETLNFNHNFTSGYILIANDDYSGSADITVTQVTASHLPSITRIIQTLSGSVEKYYTNEYEFNGELEGSEYVVTDGNLSNNVINQTQVYTTGGWYDGGNSAAPSRLLFDSGSQRVLYNFNPTRTYYVSFEARIWGGPLGTIPVRLVDNTGRVLFSGSATGASTASLSVNKAEFTNAFPNLYWQVQTGTYTPTGYSASINDVYFYEAIQDDLDNAPVENFIDTYRINNNLFDLDFSSNPNIAINKLTVVSGSGTRATVPDSNYTIAKSANPRYFGCKVETYNSRSASESYPEYFAYAQYTELVDSSVGFSNPTGRVKITALIDTDGNSFSIDNRGNNLGIVQNLFASGSPVTFIWPTADTGSAITSSNYNVLIPGGITGPLTLVPTASETIVTIDNYFDRDTANLNGILIPPNFNPYFTGSFVELAQQAGFFKTL
jgi:hypothetical protein